MFSFYASVASGAVHRIGLKVSNLDKTMVSQKSLTLTSRDPEVLIYEEETTGGPNMSRAVKKFEMFAGEEKKFRMLPYFFSKNGAGDLSFSWKSSGANVENDETTDVLSVKLTNDAAGSVSITALVESAKNIIQRARASFVINIF